MNEALLAATILELVCVAVGQASMCWDPPPGDQVFDSTRAEQIAKSATEKIVNAIREVKNAA